MLKAEGRRPHLGRILLERFRQGLELYGIVHFGLNTFTDREWGYGDEAPAQFALTSFDADQMVRGCRDGGLQGLIMVCKHHDGFCLWPSATTCHTIAHASFQGGRGDLVREVAESCRKFGLRFGVYVSPWDRNSALYGTPAYVTEVFQAQLREVLSGYGPVFEMWFDGANGGDGYYGGARETRRIPADYYRWEETIAMVRQLQPDCAIFGDADAAELRWPGNESGFCAPECRATFWTKAEAAVQGRGDREDKGRGCRDGSRFCQPECDFPLRPGWFYHAAEEGRGRTPEQLLAIYLSSVGHGGAMNIGIAPDRQGRLCPADVATLAKFQVLRQGMFSRRVFSSSDAEAATDLGGQPFNVVVLREDVAEGERIDGYRLQIQADGAWRDVLSGESIGVKRIRLLPAVVSATAIRLLVTADAGGHGRVGLDLYLAGSEPQMTTDDHR